MRKFRTFITKHFDIVRLLVSVTIALIFGIVIINIVSEDPGNALSKLFFGPFQNLRRFANIIEMMIPLTISGLSITVMFSANQFNMGTEGAFYAGGAVAAITALTFSMPKVISPIVSILAGALIGGAICLISGALKAKWGTSELVSSLMLNYVAYYIFKYIALNRFKDPKSGFPSTDKLPEAAKLTRLVPKTRIHFGLIIMVVLVILVTLYMKKSKAGFSLKLTGQNQNFAKYSGIGVAGVILSSQFIGGMLGGIGGAVEVLGMYDRFQWVSLPGYGFDGVIVAILARQNPALVPVAAFFLSYLRIGTDVMSSSSDVTNEIMAILQGIIILFVSAKVFLEHYRQKLVVKEATEQ